MYLLFFFLMNRKEVQVSKDEKVILCTYFSLVMA